MISDQRRCFSRYSSAVIAGLWAVFALSGTSSHADWLRFRGPNGSGVAEGQKAPTAWNDTENVAWKAELPGPGSSSAVIVGNKVFITCFSGYGVDPENLGELSSLRRHVLAYDTATGDKLWEKTVSGSDKEDSYSGMLGEHGYASNTPVSDGDRLYVFFGKAGVVAYDLDGKELWKTDVGQESGPMHWGSGASPIEHGDTVIVNASEEASAMIGLDKKKGSIMWRAQAEGVGNTWGTPIMVGEGDAAEIVLGVPNEIWGMNPKTGKLRWFAEALEENTFCSSLVTDGQVVYAIDGRQGESVAVRTGGKGDVTKSNLAWRGRAQGRVTSPVLYEGNLYTITRGVVQCLSAETGKEVYQTRLSAPGTEPAAVPAGGEGGGPGGGGPGGPGVGGRGGFGGGGGRGGRGGGQDYSSPIVVDGNIYTINRAGLAYVFKTGPKLEVLAENKFASDPGKFNGTPAVSNGQLYLRSDKYLYCIAEKK